jgi:hypothetical protein
VSGAAVDVAVLRVVGLIYEAQRSALVGKRERCRNLLAAQRQRDGVVIDVGLLRVAVAALGA